jgi:hypothetical protein
VGHSSKAAQANSLQDPILKTKTKTFMKRAGGVAQGIGLEFKPQYCKKKKKKKKVTEPTWHGWKSPNLSQNKPLLFIS